ncbi:MAG: hypothetical protein WCT11_00850 [Candidatus Magasanikbacteria bacterium]
MTMPVNQAQSGSTQRLNLGAANAKPDNSSLGVWIMIGVGIAIFGLILAIIGIVKASSADDHADVVGQAVVSLSAEHAKLATKVDTNQAATVTQLAAKVSKAEFDAAIAKLDAKAEQSVVDKLKTELGDKASNRSVTDLRNLLGDKADTKALRSLARKLKRLDARVEGLALPEQATNTEQ